MEFVGDKLNKNASFRFEKALIKQNKDATDSFSPPQKNVTVATNTDPMIAKSEFKVPVLTETEFEIPTLKSVHSSRAYQFFAGFLPVLLFGLILITLFAQRSPPNNWRREWGPQLTYDSLPPS